MSATPPTDSDISGTPIAVTFDYGAQTGVSGKLMGRSKANLGGSVVCVQYAVDYYPASSSTPVVPVRLTLTDANNVSK